MERHENHKLPSTTSFTLHICLLSGGSRVASFCGKLATREMSVLVYLCHLLDVIWSHLGDTPRGMSVKGFLGSIEHDLTQGLTHYSGLYIHSYQCLRPFSSPGGRSPGHSTQNQPTIAVWTHRFHTSVDHEVPRWCYHSASWESHWMSACTAELQTQILLRRVAFVTLCCSAMRATKASCPHVLPCCDCHLQQ